MFDRKAEGGLSIINMFLIGAILLVVIIAFIPILVATINDVQFEDSEFRLIGETQSYTNATAIGLDQQPLLLDTNDLNNSNFIVSNATDGTRINASTGLGRTELGYEILFFGNSTIIFHGITATAQDFDFNYSVTQQNSTGISTSSILLLTLVLFIFVAFIVVLSVKKFIK